MPVKIAGVPKLMLLDTGGGLSEIFGRAADELKLRVQLSALAQYGVSGKYSDKATIAPIEIGPLKADKAPFIVAPDILDDDTTHAGILGPDILHNYDVHLDFGNNTLALLSQDHCEGKVIYWPATAVAVVPMQVLASGHIIIQVMLDGKSIFAMVDTGAYQSTLSIPAAESYFDLKLGSPDAPVAGDLQERPGSKTYLHTFKTLDFDGIAVGNIKVQIIPDMTSDLFRNKPAIGTHIPDRKYDDAKSDMLIGMDVLRHLNIYIAYKEQKLYITPATPSGTNRHFGTSSDERSRN
ncbi:MAG: pepsin/retropepsin-like aspartic protease family protein [Rhizomicrobium sp.]